MNSTYMDNTTNRFVETAAPFILLTQIDLLSVVHQAVVNKPEGTSINNLLVFNKYFKPERFFS